MALVGLLLRARVRQRWRSWLLLCVLVALVSGLVLAAAASARRTATAFPRFEAAHGYDAFVLAGAPLPKMAALPGVVSVTPLQSVSASPPACACSRPVNDSDFNVFEVAPGALSRVVKLVAGRMPDQSDPDQVLASFTLAQDAGVHVGTVIRVPLYSASQRDAVLSGASVKPGGPTFGALFVLFAAATLMHVLVVSVARRRREAGLLKALGFVRRQVAFAVSWQATTTALIGIIAGVPAGIAVGRLIWLGFASSFGVVPVPVVTAWAIVAVVLGAVLIANVLAIGPAAAAARSRPASLLRAE